MREEGLGSKPLAEAVQAVLLENLNMKTELEVLEQRVFRDGSGRRLQFVWIRWFMDYPDPHNEYFDTFYGKKTRASARRGSTTPSTRSSRRAATRATPRSG